MDENELVDENKSNDDKTKYLEGLDKYYEMKDQYETSINNEKKKIIAIPNLSWKEKRLKYSELRPKCINCGRPVGSVFTSKENEDFERILSAVCGDKENPCPFNIKINLAETNDLRELIKEDEENLMEYKKSIILDKNDFLFGYITSEEAVKKFEEIREKVITATENTQYFLTLFNVTTDSTTKKEMLNKTQTELYTNIENIQKMMSEYEKTNNKQFVTDAVDVYIDDMIPRLKKLMNLKYAKSYVDYEDDGTYKLVQLPYSVEQLEFVLGDQKVEKMQLGLKEPKEKKTKEKSKSDTTETTEYDEEGNKKYKYKEEMRIGE
jgi:hypothetical protein|uniref:Uncharacterized protein n=1 Tax=viral metagenome TaxID=1070528 RepID=A0A6C0CY08_9ZZZZ